MPLDSSNSARDSGPTSTSAANAPANKPASESAFLTQQAADAKAAIARVTEEIKNDLAQGVDPRAWMQVAPWTTLAAGAVAGFVAAAMVVPSKEQQALRRLRRMEKAMRLDDEPTAGRNGHDRDAARDVKAAAKPSTLGALLGSVVSALQPVLMTALSNAFAGTSTPPMPGSGDAARAAASGPAAGGTTPPNEAANEI
jgi:hypothetical protein